MSIDTPRFVTPPESDPALHGSVHFSPIKSLWMSSMYVVAIVGGALTFSVDALLIFLITSAVTLCFGHSLGMHRRLIHNSYECPKWLEYSFVYLGVLVGLAGPIGMMRTHDLRDWAQRQKRCHDYFAHQQSMMVDWYWQVHCDVKLKFSPEFTPETHIQRDKIYAFMEKYWMWQQLPLALVLAFFGGVSWVVWGVCVRVAVSVTGHWLVGYFAHNDGEKHWHVEGAAVQGHNIKHLGLLTMGECWHNNHHAFPGSAKLGLHVGEVDPGWWVLRALEKVGLVWNIKLPNDLAERPELQAVPKQTDIAGSILEAVPKRIDSSGSALATNYRSSTNG